MASELYDTVADAGSAFTLVGAELLGTFTVKLVERSQVITMDEDREYVWKTLRRWKWRRHATIPGRWVQQRDYQRVRVPLKRSRARDHTIVPSKVRKSNLEYWVSLDPKFRLYNSNR